MSETRSGPRTLAELAGDAADRFGNHVAARYKRDGEWRIARRVMLYDWYQDWGQSIDWSKGVMGLPFSAGHYSGRSVGDHSESFFKEKWPRK